MSAIEFHNTENEIHKSEVDLEKVYKHSTDINHIIDSKNVHIIYSVDGSVINSSRMCYDTQGPFLLIELNDLLLIELHILPPYSDRVFTRVFFIFYFID